MIGKVFQRKDRQVEAKVLAVTDRGVLIDARWGQNNRNVVNVSKEYFKRKYGVEATA